MEKEKNLNDLRSKYQEIRGQVEKDHRQELDNFNKGWDEKLTALNELFNRQESSLKDTQKQEVEKVIKNFEDNYPLMKLSAEILNLQKILDQLIKKTE